MDTLHIIQEHATLVLRNGFAVTWSGDLNADGMQWEKQISLLAYIFLPFNFRDDVTDALGSSINPRRNEVLLQPESEGVRPVSGKDLEEDVSAGGDQAIEGSGEISSNERRGSEMDVSEHRGHSLELGEQRPEGGSFQR